MNERPPTGYDRLTGALAEYVDRACDDLEKAWQAGQFPALDSYLSDVPEAAAPVLLRELILVDAVYRERAGRSVDYHKRFPDLNSDWLAAALAGGRALVTSLPGGPASIERPPPALDRFLDGCDGPDSAALAAELLATDQAYWDHFVACYPTQRERGAGAANVRDALPGQPAMRIPGDALSGRPAIPGLVLKKVLGSGGMGVVFKARQPTLDRDVAVKFLRDPNVAHRERFKQEARAVARLRHPNLVQLFEFGQIPRADGAGSQPYLVLEYVAGGSLADRLRGTRPPAASAARLVESLAEAIQYAHQQGVIHRDLKPANILLQESGDLEQEPATTPATTSQVSTDSCPPTGESWTPKITDFGLARFLAGSNLTVTGDLLGTPSYMAPEQTTGKSADITPAVDVYGLGTILYEALTGRPPFAGEMTLRQVQEDEPVPPRRLDKFVPRDLETICLKCLRKEPGHRYASALELALDLRRFRSGEPISARAVGTAERVLVWCRRRPLVAGLVAALAVVFVVGLASALWQLKLASNREVEVKKAHELAQVQKERADDNLKKLREKVDRLSDLGRDLAKDPRLQKTALTVLEEALTFYDQILPKETMDPRLRAEAARMYGEVAATYHRTGKWHQSVDAYRRQAELLSAMVRDGPADPELRERLAGSYNNRGHVLRDLGEMPDARAVYQEAVAIQERLVAESPNHLNRQTGLANILLNLVTSMSSQSEAEEIEKILRRAVKLNRAVVDADGPGSRFRFELALSLDGLGWRLFASGKLPETVATVGESLGIYKTLLSAEPQNEKLKRYVARAYTAQGDISAATGNAEDAEQAYRESVELLSPLAEHATDDTFYRMELAGALANWGALLNNTGRKKEAEALLRQATGHYKALKEGFPEAERNALMLAASYLKLVGWLRESGRIEEAAEPYRLAFEVAPDNATVNNELAWFLVTSPEPRFWEPARAVQLAQKAINGQPKNSSYWNTLGVAHYRAGDFKQAVSDLTKSIELSTGGGSEDFFLLAMAHWQLGDQNDARSWFQKGVEWMDKNEPGDPELLRFRSETQELLSITGPTTTKGANSPPPSQ